MPATDVSTSLVDVIRLVISPSTSSEALAPGSENVSSTVRLNGLSPVTVITGATMSPGSINSEATSPCILVTFAALEGSPLITAKPDTVTDGSVNRRIIFLFLVS